MRTRERRASRRFPFAVPVGWFVMVVVAAGLLLYVQEAAQASAIPVQTGARIALVGLIAVAILGPASRATSIGPARSALAFFASSACVTLAIQVLSRPASDALANFLFLYGSGIFLAAALFVPLTIPRLHGFGTFAALATVFALWQVVHQNLNLPPTYLHRFGITFVDFVNGRLRAVSFFASPPRCAELLVFVLAVFNDVILNERRHRLACLAAYPAVVFALYNTYSRSGFLLLLACSIGQLVLSPRRRGMSTRARNARIMLICGLLVVGSIVVIGGLIPRDLAVTNGQSLVARQGHWHVLLDDLRSADIGRLLFGGGQAARFAFGTPQYFVIDNVYLAFLLYSGVVGLLAVVYLMFRLLKISAHIETRRVRVLRAFCIGLLAEGVFVDNHNTLFVALLALLGMTTFDGDVPADVSPPTVRRSHQPQRVRRAGLVHTDAGDPPLESLLR